MAVDPTQDLDDAVRFGLSAHSLAAISRPVAVLGDEL